MGALLTAINAARAQARVCVNGQSPMPAVAPLAWNAQLAAAADRHSTDMAVHNFMDHTGSDGSSAGQRITQAGYVWRAWGENIAAGYPTVAAVVQGWLGSPGHCGGRERESRRELNKVAGGSGRSRWAGWPCAQLPVHQISCSVPPAPAG